MLGRLDDWLIDRVAQPVADRLAHWTTPQALAKSLMVGVMVFRLSMIMAEWREEGLSASDVIFDALGLAFFLYIWASLPASSQAGQLPAERLQRRPLRCLCVCVDPFLVALVVLSVWIGDFPVWRLFFAVQEFLWLAALYFAACRNMPPKRRVEVRAGKLAPVGVEGR